MKLILNSLVLVLFFSFLKSQAQDCNYLTFTKGAMYEMETYNAKDKKTGSVRSTVKEVAESGSKKEATVHSEMYNSKNEKETEGDIKVICEGGKLLVDISNFMKDNPMAANNNMEMKIEGSFLEIPSGISIGQTLPDGNATMKLIDKKSGQEFATVKVTIFNRKVEGKEKINTPAGTFDCFKISYETKVETYLSMGMKTPTSNTKGVDYHEVDLGLTVKTQSFDKKGGLVGYQLLTQYSK